MWGRAGRCLCSRARKTTTSCPRRYEQAPAPVTAHRLETQTQSPSRAEAGPAFCVNFAIFSPACSFLLFPNLPLALVKQFLAPPSQPPGPDPAVGGSYLPRCPPSRRIYSLYSVLSPSGACPVASLSCWWFDSEGAARGRSKRMREKGCHQRTLSMGAFGIRGYGAYLAERGCKYNRPPFVLSRICRSSINTLQQPARVSACRFEVVHGREGVL